MQGEGWKKEGEMSDKRGAIILSSGWLHFYNCIESALGCAYKSINMRVYIAID